MASRWCWRACIVILLLLSVTTISCEDYFNEFAVQCDGGRDTVEEIARDHGFIVERELPNIGVYILSHPHVNHRSKRSAENILHTLTSHPKVIHAQQEVELIREKREILHDKQLEMPFREIHDNSVYHRLKSARLQLKDVIPGSTIDFNDPCFQDEWYIRNEGQSGGIKDVDLNIVAAWENGYTGKGVVATILDDGIDHTHLDLMDNYDPEASTDLNDHNRDPMPNRTNAYNSHGTRCAGALAAYANNNICGVGVAYHARIGGVRLLDGRVTDSSEAEALIFNCNYVDIYSASWGPKDNGKTMAAPLHFAKAALRKGVTEGRKGLGSIYVWATGNGGANDDDCSADGYVSSVETLSVGSISDKGRRPYFMENCSSTIAVVPSGGEEVPGEERRHNITKLKVITTNINNGCIENFQGTSSAAPIAAGCIALLLQANPYLSWRDVQHIVIQSARIPSMDTSWIINGAGLHVSHTFGYGVMDCGKMVELAQNWNNVPKQHVCSYDRFSLNSKIRSHGHIESHIFVDGCKDKTSQRIDRLEHVQIHIKLSHNRRGDVQIFLTSPAGTKSEILSPRSRDSFKGEWEFTFMTLHTWGEYPAGLWKLEIWDNPGTSRRHSNQGWLSGWTLTLYGTSGRRVDRMLNYLSREQRSVTPDVVQVMTIMDKEHKKSKQLSIKRNFVPDNLENKANIIASDLLDALRDENVHSFKRVDTHYTDAQLYNKLGELLKQDDFEKRQNLDSVSSSNDRPYDEMEEKHEEPKREFNVKQSNDRTQLLIDLLKELSTK